MSFLLPSIVASRDSDVTPLPGRGFNATGAYKAKLSRDSISSKGVPDITVNEMANTLDVFRKFYSELTKVLPMIITSLVTKLYSDKLLSGDQKSTIDSLATNKEKTEYFLYEVIRPGLEINYIKSFDEMLRVMESSDDPTVNYLVNEIHKFNTVSSMPSVDRPKPAVQSRGN